MITSDHRQFVIRGKTSEYVYVFEMPPTLLQSLESDFKDHLAIQIYEGFSGASLSILQGGKTYARIQTRLTDDASEQQKQQAFALGYQTSSSGRIYYNHVIPKHNTEGRRYLLSEFDSTTVPVKIGQIDSITVEDSQKKQEQSQAVFPLIFVGGIALFATYPWTILLIVPWGLKP
ncbi:hypothetical protein [Hylemonella gracilis]|uniref:hypothetical protein n=1 Tax=Hylemonella gracilis TaxID=80880 RepID=UPI00145D17BA|nr:hypothetical protein [Hylemonella gracilis]